jgi:hypothetical protein
VLLGQTITLFDMKSRNETILQVNYNAGRMDVTIQAPSAVRVAKNEL